MTVKLRQKRLHDISNCMSFKARHSKVAYPNNQRFLVPPKGYKREVLFHSDFQFGEFTLRNKDSLLSMCDWGSGES
jgi:hypothetical protein